MAMESSDAATFGTLEFGPEVGTVDIDGTTVPVKEATVNRTRVGDGIYERTWVEPLGSYVTASSR